MGWVFGTYVIAADFLPNLLLLLINCIGYLPYSDRPGPGWQAPHLPQKSELSFFFGFALYLGIPTVLYGLGQTLLAFVYEVCSLPRWLVRILGATLGFLAAGLLMGGAGWMIAISALGVYVAAGCGLFWGLLVMPALIIRRPVPLPLAARLAAPLILFVAGGYYLVRPLIPNPAETTVSVFAIRQTPLGKPFADLDWPAFGGMPRMDTIPGGLFSPVSLSTFSMSDKRRSRVLLIMFDQENSEEPLNVPRTGDAIYSEKNHQWTTLLKPEHKGSFRIKVSREFGVVSVGECCHSSRSTNFTYPPRPTDKLTPGGRGGF
jgi:hypothetical protein